MDVFPMEFKSTKISIMIDRFPAGLKLFDPKEQVMVALWPNYTWYPISLQGPLHWTYVGEKFKLCETDAKAVTDVLTRRLREKYGGTCVAAGLNGWEE
jgi:hypothetical protein